MRLACLAICVLAACGGADENLPGDDAPDHDAAAIDAATTDGATGSVCGGFGGLPCPESHYCDYPTNGCGVDDGSGTCMPRPELCKPLEEPVCGCDGTVYATDCAAAVAGQDVSAYAGCTPPDGDFACGHRFCDAATEYCQRSVSDVIGIPDDWTCLPLPAGCGASPDCDCLDGEPCGTMCSATGDGFRLTCPGG